MNFYILSILNKNLRIHLDFANEDVFPELSFKSQRYKIMI
jgi:hypothetical protein